VSGKDASFYQVTRPANEAVAEDRSTARHQEPASARVIPPPPRPSNVDRTTADPTKLHSFSRVPPLIRSRNGSALRGLPDDLRTRRGCNQNMTIFLATLTIAFAAIAVLLRQKKRRR
jgi:hypothetical protein